MEVYNNLSRAQLSFEYLHTNSTTHEFLFGAIAELIDNSRDAAATELDIYTILDDGLRGGYMLCFLDNGCGMTTEETRSVIIFGRSVKKAEESTAIGMYGNGLKSGSMRIGNDMILFTKKDDVLTCLFLSRTFHEEEKIEEVIVPLPSFKTSDKQPIADNPEDKRRHDLEVQLILKYSPFKCLKDLFSQFDKIKGPSGTLVIIYNMKLLDNGEAELDVFSDSKDVILTHPDLGENAGVDVDVELSPERRSLRAYVSILYSDPRMKVYLQGRKVQTKRLVSCLYKPRMYHYASKTFKTRAETEVARAKEEVKIAEMKAKEAESKSRDIENRYTDVTDAETLKLIRFVKNKALDAREVVKQKQNAYNRKNRALKEPKTLTFYFGLNLDNRACDGMFVFNCSRLIKMYQRIGPQQDSGLTCRGVVGIVNVPYLVLEPTHNKQDFADAKEFRFLMRAMADHLMQYWDDVGLDNKSVSLMWAKYGYQSAKWRDPPSMDENFVKRRALSVNLSVQCDQCLKWRVLPFQQNLIGKEIQDSWQCKDNPDPKHKKCSEPEQQLNIPVDTLKRKIKTKEQRQTELEEQIRKKQEELEKITGEKKTLNANRKSRLIEESDEEEEEEEEEESDSEEDGDLEKARPSRKVKTVANRAIQQEKNQIPSSTHRPQKVEETVINSKRPPPPTSSIALQNRNLKSHQVTRVRSPQPTSNSAHTRKTKSNVITAGIPPAKSARLSSSSTRSSTLASISKSNPFASKPLPAGKITVKSDTIDPASTVIGSGTSSKRIEHTEKQTGKVNGTSDGPGSVIKAEPMESNDKSAGSDEPSPFSLDVQVKIKSDGYNDDEDDSEELIEWEDAKIVSIRPGFSNENIKEIGVILESESDNSSTKPSHWIPLNSGNIKYKPGCGPESSKPSNTVVEKVVDNLKVCLRYFLPPEWPVDKDTVHALSIQELSEFPLEKFFDKYEQGLRKLFTKFQNDTSIANDKLSNLRKDVKRLLEKVNPDTSKTNIETSNQTENTSSKSSLEDIDEKLRSYLSSA